ncbi:hypothetical protein [Stagnihabitans tardus]|uniref:Uncharacterized protein n=1 Tax=Stagnihabitans tardus TaxID=2699202 RepID=A0AAE4Y9G8_9RHOB|nr:hypothetical protein [Stagnihabitans tardus]NBZ88513.1 hypothetical protein [Stagnihabitans tardus]
MYSQLEKLLQRRMTLLMTGRMQELAEEYVYPLPIYVAGRQEVMRDAEEMVTTLTRLAAIQKSKGVAKVDLLLDALEMPRHGRFRIWLTHINRDARGEIVEQGQLVHYCRVTEAGIKIEMSDYPDCQVDWVIRSPRRALA